MVKSYEWLHFLKYVLASLVFAIGIAITPWMKRLAYAERGYQAIGGEYAPLVLSIIIAIGILHTFTRMQANLAAHEEKKQSR